MLYTHGLYAAYSWVTCGTYNERRLYATHTWVICNIYMRRLRLIQSLIRIFVLLTTTSEVLLRTYYYGIATTPSPPLKIATITYQDNNSL